MELDDLAHGPERRDGDEVRLHEAPCRLLRVLEVALDRDAVAGRQPAQDLLLVAFLEALVVGGVVGVELGDGLGQEFGSASSAGNSHRLVDLEDLEIERRAQRLDQRDALLGLEQADRVAIGRPQRSRNADGAVGVATMERVRNLLRERRVVDGRLVLRP